MERPAVGFARNGLHQILVQRQAAAFDFVVEYKSRSGSCAAARARDRLNAFQLGLLGCDSLICAAQVLCFHCGGDGNFDLICGGIILDIVSVCVDFLDLESVILSLALFGCSGNICESAGRDDESCRAVFAV